jgi:hypothetical protein
MKEKDGGPAFPLLGFSDGMTLRDYFAAKALQGIISLQDGAGSKDETAVYCYQYADAMLHAREGL